MPTLPTLPKPPTLPTPHTHSRRGAVMRWVTGGPCTSQTACPAEMCAHVTHGDGQLPAARARDARRMHAEINVVPVMTIAPKLQRDNTDAKAGHRAHRAERS